MHVLLLLYSCFLSHIGAFWGAFLAPILAIMMFNVVIFVWVIVVLVRYTRRTAAHKKEAVSSKTIVRKVISIIAVMFLFGLTWLFAILTFSVTGLRETFQILFTVFNSLQGFFIFLFVLNMETLGYWKELLSCAKSKHHHPSQGTNTAAKKLQHSKPGFSSPFGGKHTSETSPTKGNDSELEDIDMLLFEPKMNIETPEPDKILTETAILTEATA